MREKTQANLRNQGVAIAEVRGALQILAQTNLVGKEAIQERIAVMEKRLTEIQNRLTEIEFSEPIVAGAEDFLDRANGWKIRLESTLKKS
jgi:DNA-binding transcriptional MerR regulator